MHQTLLCIQQHILHMLSWKGGACSTTPTSPSRSHTIHFSSSLGIQLEPCHWFWPRKCGQRYICHFHTPTPHVLFHRLLLAADQLDADGPGELSEDAQGDSEPQREGAQVPESLGEELPGLTMRTKETCIMCNNAVVGCCSRYNFPNTVVFKSKYHPNWNWNKISYSMSKLLELGTPYAEAGCRISCPPSDIHKGKGLRWVLPSVTRVGHFLQIHTGSPCSRRVTLSSSLKSRQSGSESRIWDPSFTENQSWNSRLSVLAALSAVTNYHKLGSLERQKFIFSESRYQSSGFLLEALRRRKLPHALLLPCSGCKQSSISPGLQQRNSNLCLCLHIMFLVGVPCVLSEPHPNQLQLWRSWDHILSFWVEKNFGDDTRLTIDLWSKQV